MELNGLRTGFSVFPPDLDFIARRPTRMAPANRARHFGPAFRRSLRSRRAPAGCHLSVTRPGGLCPLQLPLSLGCLCRSQRRRLARTDQSIHPFERLAEIYYLFVRFCSALLQPTSTTSPTLVGQSSTAALRALLVVCGPPWLALERSVVTRPSVVCVRSRRSCRLALSFCSHRSCAPPFAPSTGYSHDCRISQWWATTAAPQKWPRRPFAAVRLPPPTDAILSRPPSHRLSAGSATVNL